MSSEIALVSGASRGIGLAIVQKLIEEGMEVFGLARDFSKTNFQNGNFHKIECDLRDLTSIRKLPQQIQTLDILVNNAGVGSFSKLEELSEKQIEDMLAVNLKSVIYLTQTFLPQIRASKGKIINIGSESGIKGEKFGTVYCATKFGLRGFAEALSAELRKDGVSVTTLNPGMVKSSFFDDKNFQPENRAECFLTTDDVAEMLWQVINLRQGIMLKEFNFLPQVKSIVKK